MTTSVRLDADTERLLRRLERERGQSRSVIIRAAIHVLAERELPQDKALNHYEALKPFIGRVRSGGLNLSKRTGEQFTRLLVERRSARRPR